MTDFTARINLKKERDTWHANCRGGESEHETRLMAAQIEKLWVKGLIEDTLENKLSSNVKMVAKPDNKE